MLTQVNRSSCFVSILFLLIIESQLQSIQTVRNGNRIVFPSDRNANRPSNVRSSNVDYSDAIQDTNITDVRQFLGAFGLKYEQLEGPVLGRTKSAEIPLQANCHVETRTIDLDTG